LNLFPPHFTPPSCAGQAVSSSFLRYFFSDTDDVFFPPIIFPGCGAFRRSFFFLWTFPFAFLLALKGRAPFFFLRSQLPSTERPFSSSSPLRPLPWRPLESFSPSSRQFLFSRGRTPFSSSGLSFPQPLQSSLDSAHHNHPAGILPSPSGPSGLPLLSH